MNQTVLAQFLLHVGDSQLILSHRLSEWCGHAPELGARFPSLGRLRGRADGRPFARAVNFRATSSAAAATTGCTTATRWRRCSRAQVSLS